MSAPAFPQLEANVTADDFRALEEKIYKTIELLKLAREAKTIAEREATGLREQLEQREEQIDALKGQVLSLRRDREEVRGRVEKILKQIDAIAAES